MMKLGYWLIVSIAAITGIVITRQYIGEPVYVAAASDVSLQTFPKQQFAVLATELSPAAVVRCGTKSVSLFSNLLHWGVGAPQYAALPTAKGVSTLKSGSTSKTAMAEPWILCWFNGAEGWKQWDAPMLVVLQHKPGSVSLGGDGLTLEFPKEAGMIAVMPLYGYQKLDNNSAWAKGLPQTVVDRCRYFSQALRMIPVYCREEYSLQGDDLLIRSHFTWLPIEDDWGTKPVKLAPFAPNLGLAWWAGKHNASKPFPMSFSDTVTDPDYFTPYGPYVGVEGKDGYTVKMNVLKYVHHVEKPDISRLAADPNASDVLRRLREVLSNKFDDPNWKGIWDHGGQKNYCWQVMGDRWYARAIPYMPEDLQQRMKAILRSYTAECVLQKSSYKPFEHMLVLTGPGIGQWGGADDAGKFASNVLETLWDIGYHTDCWDLIKARWDMVKQLFITPLESDWKSVGRYYIAELGDEAGPPLAMARLAYKVGDKETYGFASYVFARELVHHYVKQVGAEYYRKHQPYHSDEPMPKEVYLTNLRGGLSGWDIDGPEYPKKKGERQFNNRWVRFSSDGVAWFYRDVLSNEIRSEMDLLTERAKNKDTKYSIKQDTAHMAPSIIRLRALLLNESPSKLAQICPVADWKVSRPADAAAMGVSFLRGAVSIEQVRIIPPADIPFTLGREKLNVDGFPALAVIVDAPNSKEAPPELRGYPYLRWKEWRSPKEIKGMSRWWSFGQIVPGGLRPGRVESHQVNWNTCIWSFEP